ncbi:hypothetical protein [Candidatus Nitrotoga sp. M5]|uniref:hypothetical protein n=1 Tax=Candidatus Nitrotoga sp. M5 TaxID=2890409 RepID=UPI001EF72F27|nr:hypothetical protein [Candidatus Nitrotoga sp. M5]CAH1387022.1 conserved hypothetical protein [Candidatus Nitrotoga sp. M5]
MAQPTKRYYLADLMGDGGEFNPWALTIQNYNVPMTTLKKEASYDWGLAIVETDDHSALLADSTITSLPDFPIDGRLSSINTSTVLQMVVDLQARGIDAAFTVSADGYADVIQSIGALLDPAFDVQAFKITE